MKITPSRIPTVGPGTILAFVVALGVSASLLLTRFAVTRGVSCEAGDLTACVELGQAYQTVDITRTVDLWQRACDGGEMMGCANLGVMYEHGSGVKQDFTRAVGLYEEACEGGGSVGLPRPRGHVRDWQRCDPRHRPGHQPLRASLRRWGDARVHKPRVAR